MKSSTERKSWRKQLKKFSWLRELEIKLWKRRTPSSWGLKTLQCLIQLLLGWKETSPVLSWTERTLGLLMGALNRQQPKREERTKWTKRSLKSALLKKWKPLRSSLRKKQEFTNYIKTTLSMILKEIRKPQSRGSRGLNSSPKVGEVRWMLSLMRLIRKKGQLKGIRKWLRTLIKNTPVSRNIYFKSKLNRKCKRHLRLRCTNKLVKNKCSLNCSRILLHLDHKRLLIQGCNRWRILLKSVCSLLHMTHMRIWKLKVMKMYQMP